MKRHRYITLNIQPSLKNSEFFDKIHLILQKLRKTLLITDNSWLYQVMKEPSYEGTFCSVAIVQKIIFTQQSKVIIHRENSDSSFYGVFTKIYFAFWWVLGIKVRKKNLLTRHTKTVINGPVKVLKKDRYLTCLLRLQNTPFSTLWR